VTKSKIFFWLALSFIGGIAFASFYYPRQLGNSALLIFFLLPLIMLVLYYRHPKIPVAALALIFFAGGLYLTGLKLSQLNETNLSGKNFSGVAEILREPEISGRMQNIAAEIKDPKSLKILIATNAYQKYSYGDKLNVDCRLEVPQNKDASFDWRMYLAKEGMLYECRNPEMEKVSGGGNFFYTGLIGMKNKFEENISRLIPAPESGLLLGLLIGGSDQLSKGIRDNFSQTGLTHIVAVSGYNVTIIAEYLMILGIFIGLWRGQSFWFAATGIFVFVIVTGLSASAVRAGIMGILLIWAMKNGRLANAQNAILFSAAVMLFKNPLLLRWDVGFQLSFLATLGIVYFYPFFQNYLVKKNKAAGLLEILFLTLSAQIFVLPVILFNFHKLSLISPLANLLILPIIPLTMLLGFLAISAGIILKPLGILLSWIAYLPLKYETMIVNFLAGLKYSAVEFNLTWRGVVFWYVLLLISLRYLGRKKTVLCQNEK
jgi:competence protein ComEC